MTTKSEMARMTKDELIARIQEIEKAKPEIAEREVRIQSPAGPVHVHRGFVDDGAGPIVISGLIEDEYGHWAPYYRLTVNGQELDGPVIEHGD